VGNYPTVMTRRKDETIEIMRKELLEGPDMQQRALRVSGFRSWYERVGRLGHRLEPGREEDYAIRSDIKTENEYNRQ